MELMSGVILCLSIQAMSIVVPGQNHIYLLLVFNRSRVAICVAAMGLASAGMVFSIGVAFSIWFGGQAISAKLFSLVSLVGALYLIFLGSKLIRSFIYGTGKGLVPNENASNEGRVGSLGSVFRGGFLVNIANAKPAYFYASVFATTLPIAELQVGYVWLVISLFVLNSFVLHSAIGFMYTLTKVSKFIVRNTSYIRLVSGVVFVMFGSWVVTTVIKF